MNQDTKSDPASAEECEKIGLRLSAELLIALKARAERERRSVNGQMIWDLQTTIEQETELGFQRFANGGGSGSNFAARLPLALAAKLREHSQRGDRSLGREIAVRLAGRVAVVDATAPASTAGYDRRDDVVAELQRAVAERLATGGGVVALVAPSGFGKTVVAAQYVERSGGPAVRFFDPPPSYRGKRRFSLPSLSGVVVIDEVHLFDNLGQAVQAMQDGGVAVLLCQAEEQVKQLTGVHAQCVIRLSSWRPVTTRAKFESLSL